MKTILEQLSEINLDLFYCITIRTTSNSIDLQGRISRELLEYCDKLGVHNWNVEGKFLTARINNIEITLT